jgi:hypothetical protein
MDQWTSERMVTLPGSAVKEKCSTAVRFSSFSHPAIIIERRLADAQGNCNKIH